MWHFFLFFFSPNLTLTFFFIIYGNVKKRIHVFFFNVDATNLLSQSNWSTLSQAALSSLFRFLPLLGYQKLGGESGPVTPLGCVLDLLNAPAVAKTVVASVLEILANIVQDDQEKEDEEEEVSKGEPLPEPFVFPSTGEKKGSNVHRPLSNGFKSRHTR